MSTFSDYQRILNEVRSEILKPNNCQETQLNKSDIKEAICEEDLKQQVRQWLLVIASITAMPLILTKKELSLLILDLIKNPEKYKELHRQILHIVKENSNRSRRIVNILFTWLRNKTKDGKQQQSSKL